MKQPFTTPPVSQVLRTAFGFLQAVNVLLWIYANMSMRFGLLRGIKDLYIRPHVPGELPYLGAFLMFAVLWLASPNMRARRRWLNGILFCLFLQAALTPG